MQSIISSIQFDACVYQIPQHYFSLQPESVCNANQDGVKFLYSLDWGYLVCIYFT